MAVRSQLERLFNDFQTFEEKYWSVAFQEEREQMSVLLSAYQVFDKYHLSDIIRKESPAYNIFSILNVRHYEEKLHTPFLVNLLNPSGSHGQGSLFLDSFIAEVLHLDYRYIDISAFSIKEEFFTVNGRIDIFMSFLIRNERVVIVIENKIYAQDQYQQLERYYKELQSQGVNDATGKLYYLTPYKTNATEQSISLDLMNDLFNRGVLHNIGYHNDIYPWLENNLPLIQSPKVKYTIQQYLKTIKTL